MPNLTHQLRVQSGADACGLATYSHVIALQSVQFLAQGQPVDLARVGRELLEDECSRLLRIHHLLLDEVVDSLLDLPG